MSHPMSAAQMVAQAKGRSENLNPQAMRIGRAALFLPGVIRRRVSRGHPEPAPTATRAMPIRETSGGARA